MSDNAAPPGRTGRGRARHPAEAPPPSGQPEDEPAVEEAAAEPAVTDGIYFAKAPNRDVWHAYDEEHEAVGSVYDNGTDWKVRVNRTDLPAKFASAASARACLMGWWMRGDHDRRNARSLGMSHADVYAQQQGHQPGHLLPGQGQPGGDQPVGSGTGSVAATGTDAAHDASTRV